MLQVKLVLAVLTALFVLIPFCYIPASAAVFVVKVRTHPAYCTLPACPPARLPTTDCALARPTSDPPAHLPSC